MARFIQPDDYIVIGTIKKAKGLDGVMVVALAYPTMNTQLDMVFLHRCHTYIPYRVQQWKMRNGYATIRLWGVDNVAEVRKLYHDTLFADRSKLADLPHMDINLIGYQVKDVTQGCVGKVINVTHDIETLLHIAYEGKTYDVLKNNHFIVDIDHHQHIVVTQLPPNYILYQSH